MYAYYSVILSYTIKLPPFFSANNEMLIWHPATSWSCSIVMINLQRFCNFFFIKIWRKKHSLRGFKNCWQCSCYKKWQITKYMFYQQKLKTLNCILTEYSEKIIQTRMFNKICFFIVEIIYNWVDLRLSCHT